MEIKSLVILLHINFECDSVVLLFNVRLVDIRSTAEFWFVFEDDMVNLDLSPTERRQRSLARELGQFASTLVKHQQSQVTWNLGPRRGAKHGPKKKRQRT